MTPAEGFSKSLYPFGAPAGCGGHGNSSQVIAACNCTGTFAPPCSRRYANSASKARQTGISPKDSVPPAENNVGGRCVPPPHISYCRGARIAVVHLHLPL